MFSLSSAATHSQIRLLRSLKKDNYQLPLLITDSGVPPLSNNTEVKVQVCICNKNRMHCSSAHSHRARFLVPLATLLLTLLCKYIATNSRNNRKLWFFVCFLFSKVNSCRFQYRLGYKINADKHGASFYLGSKQFLHLCSRVKKKDLNSLPGKNTSFNSRCTSVSCTFYVSIFPAYKPKALPRKSNLNLL